MKAFYFAQSNEQLGHGDNRKIVIGETHTVDCIPKCCKQGLHGSIKLLDALGYANSSLVYLVDIDGDIDTNKDKVCGKERTYLERYDMTKILGIFARKQALINIEKIKPYCSKEDYKLIVEWLKTGDKSLRSAAESAAWSAEEAAWSAAESAAVSAEEAAWSAAWSAAAAAWSAESAAWSAESTARSAAAKLAKSAAWSAARSAVRSEQNQQLTSMLREATGWDI